MYIHRSIDALSDEQDVKYALYMKYRYEMWRMILYKKLSYR